MMLASGNNTCSVCKVNIKINTVPVQTLKAIEDFCRGKTTLWVTDTSTPNQQQSFTKKT